MGGDKNYYSERITSEALNVAVETPTEVVSIPEFPDTLDDSMFNTWVNLWSYDYITEHFYDVVVDYCKVQYLSNEASKEVDIVGFVSTGSLGQTVVSPEFNVFDRLQARLTSLRNQLGLSPQAATKINLNMAEANKDRYAEWLKNKE